MNDMDRCFKLVITNSGPHEDSGPCNRFRGAHPGCGHEFEDGIEQVCIIEECGIPFIPIHPFNKHPWIAEDQVKMEKSFGVTDKPTTEPEGESNVAESKGLVGDSNAENTEGLATEPVCGCGHAEKYHSVKGPGIRLNTCSMCELDAIHLFQLAKPEICKCGHIQTVHNFGTGGCYGIPCECDHFRLLEVTS